MELTTNNYYTGDATRQYMSCSQYKAFMDCPQAAYHQFILEDYTPPSRDEFLMGNFAHTYFEGENAHNKFIEDNREALTSSRGPTTGKLKAEYKNFYESAKRAMADDTFAKYMRGEHEVILTGEIGNSPWMIRVDILNKDENFASDFKYMASLDGTYWISAFVTWDNEIIPYHDGAETTSPRSIEVPFYERFGYWMRFAVYRSILFQNFRTLFDMYMPVITKEIPSNHDVFVFDDDRRMANELEIVKHNLERIEKWRNGANLYRCEKCHYCRRFRRLKEVRKATSSLW